MKTTLKQNLLFLSTFAFISTAIADEVTAPAQATNPTALQSKEAAVQEKTNTDNMNPAMMSEKQTQLSTAATEEMAGFSRGTVARSVFTTLIDNREPVDKVQQVPQQKNDIFYFTELRDMAGQTAKHRWEFKGKIISEVKFKVRGPRWRVWSKKSFAPGWSGDWKVSVVNGVGEVISEEVIAYAEPAEETMQMQDANKMDKRLQTNQMMPADPVTAQ